MSDKGELTGHFALVYPSKYIKAADLMGQNVTVTILRVRKETIEMEGGKKDDKAVLYIADARGKALQKTWVAGKTVLKQIAATLGDPAIGAWKGKQVTIYPTTCKSKGGETVECIRVRPRLMQGAHDMPADMTAGDDEGPPAEKPRPAEPPAERILAGEHVVYLDFEDDAKTIGARLQALGVTDDQILAGLSYIHPHDPVDAVATAQLERVLAEHHPTLVVIDGVTEVMSINGWSINDNDDIARFFLALPKRIARHGPAVVLVDHVVKDKESRGRYGIGGQHKLAGIDGATYTLEVTRPWGLGLDGASRISVTKDRPGHVRGGSLEGRFVGEFRGQSIDGGAMHCSLSARSHTGGAPARTRPTNLMEQVSKAVRELNEGGVEPTKNAVANEVPSKKANVLIAIDQLVEERFLQVVNGPNNARHLRSLRPYRQAMDPDSDAWVGAERTPEDELPWFVVGGVVGRGVGVGAHGAVPTSWGGRAGIVAEGCGLDVSAGGRPVVEGCS